MFFLADRHNVRRELSVTRVSWRALLMAGTVVETWSGVCDGEKAGKADCEQQKSIS